MNTPEELSPKVVGAATTAALAAAIIALVGSTGRGRSRPGLVAGAAIGTGAAALVGGYLTVDPRRVALTIGDGLYEVPTEMITGARRR